MKFKQKRLSFSGKVASNVTAAPIAGDAEHYSVTNNLSAPIAQQVKTRSYEPESPHYEITRLTKPRGLLERHGSLPVWFVVLLCAAALVVPCVLVLTMYVSSTLTFPYGDCVLLQEFRTPCKIGSGSQGVDQQECEHVSCCWDPVSKQCYHSIPSRHAYLYESLEGSSVWSAGEDLELKARLVNTPLLSASHPRLRALLKFLSPHHLRVVVATPGSPLLSDARSSHVNLSAQPAMDVVVFGPAFAFEVRRRDGGVTLVSTTRSPLIASDSYWEVGLRCPPGGAVYGLGGLRLNRTVLLYGSSSRSGSFPYLLCLAPDGKAHGVVIGNSGPLEVSYLAGSNIVILRALSGSGWDVGVLAGPTPADVLGQLTAALGRLELPPYWALGLHVCRDVTLGHGVDELLAFLNSSLEWRLPYDSDCVHERLLEQLEDIASTQEASRLGAALESLREGGKNLLLSLPPQTWKVDGDVLLHLANGSVYEGQYHGRSVQYPDFTHPNSSLWFTSRLRQLTNMSSALAGFALIDNWPLDDTPHLPEDLPYLPQDVNGSLSDNTLYWTAQHWNKKRHYEIHNLYGVQQSEAVRKATKMMNPVIFSSSCSLGSPACLNQQQVSPNASWASLKEAVISVLGQGLAGVALAGGGPLCGAVGEVPEDVCLRWYQVGAVLPIMRVSSVQPLRDPMHAPSVHVASRAMAALQLRYSLLPYFYTLLHQASQSGEPLARPMFYDFPDDTATWDLDQQFMVGPALLAAPSLDPEMSVVEVYLPAGSSTWYLLDGGQPVNQGVGNLTVPLASGDDQLLLLLRAGHVLLTQEPGVDVASSLLNSYKLKVALDCDPGGQCSASGHVIMQAGVQVTFHANRTSVVVGNLRAACAEVLLPPLVEVTVMRPVTRTQDGATTQPTQHSQTSTVSHTTSMTSIPSHQYPTTSDTPEESSVTFSSSTSVPTTGMSSQVHSTSVSTAGETTVETKGSSLATSSSSTMSAGAATKVSSPADVSVVDSSSSSSSGGEEGTGVNMTISSLATSSLSATFAATLSSTPMSTEKHNSDICNNSLKVENITHKHLGGRMKRHVFPRVKSPKAKNTLLLDNGQSSTYKFNATSLCTGENYIVINYL